MRRALARSARDTWAASVARFGQARALTNARHAATGMARRRVDSEDVRLYLEALDPSEPGQVEPPRPQRSAAAGSDT